MTTNDTLYTSNILKQAIISYLDQNVPKTEEGLTILVSQCDDLVWNIATYIYNKSGHQVEFSLIRDTINNRIRTLRKQFDDIKVKAIKIKEEESNRLAQEAKIKKEYLNELSKQLKESGRNKNLCYLFSKIKEIISEQLSVELHKITLNSHIEDDLRADSLDNLEIIMMVEEYFDIEISFNNTDLIYKKGELWCGNLEYIMDCTVGKLLDEVYKIIEQQNPDKLKIAT
ncbi:hypothetical protein PCC8801_3559 [Rippkaea orientalis PCC 8801]|uniref:Carrier domain-containing protein n=1 Tax=Rippkaea orientalis (strain PCC 8801 / RF-1) TaxID=41431 RepID=B7K1I1_RIPO1|nr:acyl carrier protein [Rippkaea orientalis]ACK67523.1 hypothetical protein PCC8801_3559 [Rippkaea orientalis PCC 8801]